MTDKSGHSLFLLESRLLTCATHSAKSRGQVGLALLCVSMCMRWWGKLWSASVPCLSTGLHRKPGPKAVPATVASTLCCSQIIHAAHQTKPRERANKSQSDIIQHINKVYLYRGILFTVDAYCIYIYFYSPRACASTHTTTTHSSQEVQSRRTGPRYLISFPLPVTVRWRGGLRPCVWHKGLLRARRPSPTGRFYPAGSLPPGCYSDSLTLTEASPQRKSLTEINSANRCHRGHRHFLSEFCTTPALLYVTEIALPVLDSILPFTLVSPISHLHFSNRKDSSSPCKMIHPARSNTIGTCPNPPLLLNAFYYSAKEIKQLHYTVFSFSTFAF